MACAALCMGIKGRNPKPTQDAADTYQQDVRRYGLSLKMQDQEGGMQR